MLEELKTNKNWIEMVDVTKKKKINKSKNAHESIE